MHYQSALQKYFDGELDDVGEDMLFGELAHNYQARREFNEHTKLRATMQLERSTITPPAHAAGLVFGALGYNQPPPVPRSAPAFNSIKAAAVSSLFFKFLPYALTSLLSAIVAIVMYVEFTGQEFSKKQIFLDRITENDSKDQQNVIAEKQAENLGNSLHSVENPLRQGRNSSANLFKDIQVPTIKREYSVKRQGTFSKQNVEHSSDMQESRQKDSFKIQINSIANEDFRNDRVFKENDRLGIFSNNFPTIITLENREFLKESEIVLPQNFSIEMRSISARSFPENSVEAQSDVVKNMSISALFPFDDNQSFGVEIGHEQFAQEYNKDINGQQWYVKQNPMYIYSAVGYRYSLSKNEVMGAKITPFGQSMVGGTYIGPLAKLSVGLTLTPEERISFLIALEGSILAYQINGNWNNSRKLGVTYGINVTF